MPLYDFYCECGNEVEELQPMDERSPACPQCGGRMIKRPSSPALVRVPWGRVLPKSKGYKEGYAREYLKDNPPAQSSNL